MLRRSVCQISAVSAPSRPPLPLGVFLVLPGTAFWVLVIIGATTEEARYVAYALGLGAVTMAVFAVFKVRQLRTERAHRARAIEAGTEATARIVSTRVRGHLNHDPYVVFDLEVAPESGPAYRVQVTELVSQLAVPRIQPDALLDIHIHPDDPKYVVIAPAALGRT